jgi:hypothetical protein
MKIFLPECYLNTFSGKPEFFSGVPERIFVVYFVGICKKYGYYVY